MRKLFQNTAVLAFLGFSLTACGCARNRVVMDWRARTLTYLGKPIQPVEMAALARDSKNDAIKLMIRTSERSVKRDLKQTVNALDAADLALLTLYFYPASDEELVAARRDIFIGERVVEQHWRTQLAIAERFIRSFFAQHERLPTREELEAWRLTRTDPARLHLLANEDFIAARGGRPGIDFVVGVWTGAFYYYRQSWDGSYTTFKWERP